MPAQSAILKPRRRANKPFGLSSYRERDQIVRELGFASYREYLDSDLWRTIRCRVYRNKGGFCRICKAPATEIHHNTYTRRVMGGADIGPLHPLCRSCHKSLEFAGNGRKRWPKEVRRQFRLARRAARKDRRDAAREPSLRPP